MLVLRPRRQRRLQGGKGPIYEAVTKKRKILVHAGLQHVKYARPYGIPYVYSCTAYCQRAGPEGMSGSRKS